MDKHFERFVGAGLSAVVLALPVIAQRGPSVPTPPSPPDVPDAPVTGADVQKPVAGKIVINGKEIRIDGAEGSQTEGGTAFPFPTDMPPRVAETAQVAIVSFCLMIAAFPIFGFLKAIVNRAAARTTALPSRDTTDRLQRIESAVEAMAVEVERISEGQRFVTRVLAERSTASQP